jgi:hypothetical protein
MESDRLVSNVGAFILAVVVSESRAAGFVDSCCLFGLRSLFLAKDGILIPRAKADQAYDMTPSLGAARLPPAQSGVMHLEWGHGPAAVKHKHPRLSTRTSSVSFVTPETGKQWDKACTIYNEQQSASEHVKPTFPLLLAECCHQAKFWQTAIIARLILSHA